MTMPSESSTFASSGSARNFSFSEPERTFTVIREAARLAASSVCFLSRIDNEDRSDHPDQQKRGQRRSKGLPKIHSSRLPAQQSTFATSHNTTRTTGSLFSSNDIQTLSGGGLSIAF